MVDGSGPLPDSYQELAAWVGIGIFVVSIFAFSTTADAQIRFMITDTTNYFSASDSPKEGVAFTEQQISNMRWASVTSVSDSAFGDERLFCGFITSDGNVESIRLADDIISSEFDSVSGACRSRFPSQNINFFVHSQPGSDELSDEDRDLETSVPYTCIVYEEMAISPVSSKVSGISCYEVVGNGESFSEVPVYAR